MKKIDSKKIFQIIEDNVKDVDGRYQLERKRWDYYTNTLDMSPSPLDIDIEITNACNLKCVMCERNKMKRAVGFMNLKTFRNIIDQCVQNETYFVKLSGWGESLMHPKFFEMIEYAYKNNIHTQFNTNANFLTDDNIERLVYSGLDRITISVESINKALYEEIRIGNEYKKIMQNIENLISKKSVGKKPYITMQCLKMKRNYKTVPRFVDWYKNRVDYISVTNVGSITGDPEILKESLIDYNSVPRHPCVDLWQRLLVYWNGDVTVCCSDSDGFLTIGNLADSSLKELWHGERLNTYREKHKKLNFAGLICQNCTKICNIQ